MDNFNKTLAQNLIKLRKFRNLSQLEVSEQTGISFRTYQRIEAGEIAPRTDVAAKIFKLLNANTSEIFADSINLTRADDKHDCICCCELKKLNFRFSEMKNINPVEHSIISDPQNEKNETGYWELNTVTCDYYWSVSMYKVYGMPVKAQFKHQDFISRIAAEDIGKIDEGFERLLQLNVLYDNTHKVDIDGQLILVRSVASKYIDKNNNPIIFGIAERV